MEAGLHRLCGMMGQRKCIGNVCEAVRTQPTWLTLSCVSGDVFFTASVCVAGVWCWRCHFLTVVDWDGRPPLSAL